MAIWKSGKTLVLGRGIIRTKHERRPTRAMIKQSKRMGRAMTNTGIDIGDNANMTRVGMAFANALMSKHKQSKQWK